MARQRASRPARSPRRRRSSAAAVAASTPETTPGRASAGRRGRPRARSRGGDPAVEPFQDRPPRRSSWAAAAPSAARALDLEGRRCSSTAHGPGRPRCPPGPARTPAPRNRRPGSPAQRGGDAARVPEPLGDQEAGGQQPFEQRVGLDQGALGIEVPGPAVADHRVDDGARRLELLEQLGRPRRPGAARAVRDRGWVMAQSPSSGSSRRRTSSGSSATGTRITSGERRMGSVIAIASALAPEPSGGGPGVGVHPLQAQALQGEAPGLQPLRRAPGARAGPGPAGG